jgi:hypothetical protein
VGVDRQLAALGEALDTLLTRAQKAPDLRHRTVTRLLNGLRT